MTPHGRIKGLDGIRAIAVILVVLSHNIVYEAMGIDREKYPGLFRVLSPSNGVSIFFVLSGFLITYLLIIEHAKHGRVSLSNFYMRRILRLFPLYFLAVGMLFIMTRIGATAMEPHIFRYLFTYTQNYMPPEYNAPAIGHLWSLAVEEHFYLVWPVLFIVSRKMAFVFATVFAIVALTMGSGLPVTWTFPAAAGIAIGCVLAFIATQPLVASIFTHSIARYILLLVGVIGLLHPWYMYQHSFYLISVAIVIGYVFFNQDSLTTRMLDIKPLILIGIMSYGIYVWHGVLAGVGPYRTPDSTYPLPTYPGLLLVILIVPLSYYGYERYFLDLKDRYRSKKKSRQVSLVPQISLTPSPEAPSIRE